MLKSLFTSHPASVGENYGEHMMMASSFGLNMILCGLACVIHGLLPFLFVSTASQTIARLHDRMVVKRASLGKLDGKREITI